MKLKNIEELNQLRELARRKLADRESKIQVKVHLGTCGLSSGADKTMQAFLHEVESKKLANVLVLKAACIGLCDKEPTVTIIEPGGRKTLYHDLKEDLVGRVVEEHLLNGQPVAEYVLDREAPLLKLQEIRIMHNQDLDPMNLEEYIARDGYQALARVLTAVSPQAVLEEMKNSNIRGRGGAGFPTASKWEFVRNAPGAEKFIVCNGDEGDPGAYMNRAVLEGNPHSIIEGMAIGAYAIGNVRQGFAYIRAEYPLAIQTLSHAIAQAREYGLLGPNILGTNFEFSLDIFPGAGAFVCGEETALLASIEGRRGMPRQRPPFPANKGLFGKPTTINNVETWSNIPQIIQKGVDWFTSVGNERSKGTKTLCLVGKVNNVGLIEVPLGTPLGKIIFDIGGGIPNGKKFKAVQLGGPSGGVIPTEYLNTPVDYESVTALGAIMGSGGVIVMDEDSCMVDVAKFFLDFTRDESCGKCVPCRAGIPKLREILNRISRGEGRIEDIDLLLELGETITSTALCGLGQTSANPVLSTIRHFRAEYEAHIIDKKCPAAVCQAMFRAPCQHTCPVGLDVPGYISLIKDGKFVEAYSLIKQRNPFPSICGRVCHHPCEAKCRRGQIDEPLAIRDLKRFAADYAFDLGIEYLPPMAPRKEERVAIVGAGPAGLSAAWDLAREGYQVTVFEALPVAGGMLAVGIPEYRLPKAILKSEVEAVERLGVEIKLNTPVNDVHSLLSEGYKAVFIATGAHKSESMRIPGENLEGVMDAVDFLRKVNLGQSVKVGQKVAVVGGGNSAIDAARSALRKGAGSVEVFYRREQKDMPAIDEEIKAAAEEGIQFHYLTAPVRVLSHNGRISGLECVRMELREFDRSGRRVPAPMAGSTYSIDVDMAIQAIGQRPDTSLANDGVKVGAGGTIGADRRTLVTAQAGVFAGGDAASGPQTAIEAIAAGQRAASSIKRYLQGRGFSPLVERTTGSPIPVSTQPPPDEDTSPRNRARPGEISLDDRKGSFKEVSQAYTPEEAREEARRCLRCDLEGS